MSTANNDGHSPKHKHWASILTPTVTPPAPLVHNDDHVDVVIGIDDPWINPYAPVTQDAMPSGFTRDKLCCNVALR
jgi:hypothetical protein